MNERNPAVPEHEYIRPHERGVDILQEDGTPAVFLPWDQVDSEEARLLFNIVRGITEAHEL